MGEHIRISMGKRKGNKKNMMPIDEFDKLNPGLLPEADASAPAENQQQSLVLRCKLCRRFRFHCPMYDRVGFPLCCENKMSCSLETVKKWECSKCDFSEMCPITIDESIQCTICGSG